MDQVQGWQVQFAIAMASGTALNYLQKSPLMQWVRPDNFKKLRYVAMGIQFVTALGIHYSFEASANGGYVLQAMLPSASDMLNAGWGYFIQKHTQEHGSVAVVAATAEADGARDAATKP